MPAASIVSSVRGMWCRSRPWRPGAGSFTVRFGVGGWTVPLPKWLTNGFVIRKSTLPGMMGWLDFCCGEKLWVWKKLNKQNMNVFRKVCGHIQHGAFFCWTFWSWKGSKRAPVLLVPHNLPIQSIYDRNSFSLRGICYEISWTEN